MPRRTRAAALAVLLLLAGCDSGGDDGVGADGVGDPYFPRAGNGGYDVTHYGLTLGYTPATRQLTGTAVISARATRQLTSYNLDLTGLDVEEVTVDGEPARTSRAGQELTVRPRGGVGEGDVFTTTVRYSGVPRTLTDPDGSKEGWLPTADGAIALGEPVGSMAWFPGNHHPSDKATYDLTVTVPEGLTAVSNGELRSEKAVAGGRTFVWHSGEPMASYLATLAIGRFEVRRTGGELPTYVAVDPTQAAASRAVLGRLDEVLEWGVENFGAYPFRSAGAIVERPGDAGYALETQTRPFFAGPPELGTFVHELAHQWFGNSVTPRSWRDMWLNEGFATYAEWLWSEDHDGESAQEIFDAVYAGDYYEDAEDNDAVWEFPPGDPPGADRISDPPVYFRGAMAVHKIRQLLGDDLFYEFLQGWTGEHRHLVADTGQLKGHLERLAPEEDWDAVWDEWVFGEGRPARP
ncbi:M1 family metallopeptidase [Streptomyces roseirectus]|uniref:M1 family metallopeptidase n=1 Tax=Streptomyces roseirectus TaxID=2768066 RepID=UPI001FE9DC32|nr:M1 family metallopeptidase [Streptomyces roseirectus]